MLPKKSKILLIVAIYLSMLVILCLPASLADTFMLKRNNSPAISGTSHYLPITTVGGYLTGHFEYKNIQSGQWLPLAFTYVRIYYFNRTFLAAGYTDIYGNFTFGPIDIPLNGMTIICSATTTNPHVTVLYHDTNNKWSYEVTIFIQYGQNSFLCPFTDPDNAFTVFSYHSGLNRGWYYIYNSTGRDILDAQAQYPSGLGPCYWNRTKRMYLPGYTFGYTDTILHEYAHYVMHCLYNWFWPVNDTYTYTPNNVSDPEVAWVEGWAYFFPLAVQNNTTYEAWQETPINFEILHWCSSGWDDGENVTGRVTGAFWDIFDSQNDGYDVLSDGFNRIWNTTSYICSIEYSGFRFFWLAWNITYYPHPKQTESELQDWKKTLLALFQNTIDYRGAGDVTVDGITDISDILEVALRFGKAKGDAGWDKLCDVSPPPYGDDFIDISDIEYVALYYGATYDC